MKQKKKEEVQYVIRFFLILRENKFSLAYMTSRRKKTQKFTPGFPEFQIFALV